MASVSDVKQKVMAPAIALIVVGIIAVLSGLYSLYSGISTRANAEKFQADFDKGFKEGLKAPTNLTPEEKANFDKMGKDIGGGLGGIAQTIGTYGIVVGLVWLISGGLGIFGGLQMMSLKSYPFALIGSIAVFPVCCCIGGLPITIWSLIVLNSPDVKAAFRAAGTAGV